MKGPVQPPDLITECPICGRRLVLRLTLEAETGEYGSILGYSLSTPESPDDAIVEQSCDCDFSRPLMEVWAEYLNGDVYLMEMLDEQEAPFGTREIIPGDIFELHKLKDRNNLPTWCRMNILEAIHTGSRGILLADMYWGTDRTLYGPEEIEHMKYIGNINDFEETNHERYAGYDDHDRMYFPMGGTSARWMVRKEASPLFERKIQFVIEEIEEAERVLSSAQLNLKWKKEKLERLRERKET